MPKGSKAVIVTNKGSNSTRQDNHVYIVDLTTGDKQTVYSVDGPIEGATMNEQGTLFAFWNEKHELTTPPSWLPAKQASVTVSICPSYVHGRWRSSVLRIAVVDLNNGREMANKEFTGNLRNYHPVGKSDVGYLINQGVFGSGVNKFVTRIWD